MLEEGSLRRSLFHGRCPGFRKRKSPAKGQVGAFGGALSGGGSELSGIGDHASFAVPLLADDQHHDHRDAVDAIGQEQKRG